MYKLQSYAILQTLFQTFVTFYLYEKIEEYLFYNEVCINLFLLKLLLIIITVCKKVIIYVSGSNVQAPFDWLKI